MRVTWMNLAMYSADWLGSKKTGKSNISEMPYDYNTKQFIWYMVAAK